MLLEATCFRKKATVDLTSWTLGSRLAWWDDVLATSAAMSRHAGLVTPGFNCTVPCDALRLVEPLHAMRYWSVCMRMCVFSQVEAISRSSASRKRRRHRSRGRQWKSTFWMGPCWVHVVMPCDMLWQSCRASRPQGFGEIKYEWAAEAKAKEYLTKLGEEDAVYTSGILRSCSR